MKKLFILIAAIIFFSGCRNTSTNLQPSTIEDLPSITAIFEEVSVTEIPILIDTTDTVQPTITPRVRPRIILYIGDGLGSEHRLAGQYYSVGEIRQLTMDSLPVSGWLNTDSYGGHMSESASAATAMATGQQTNNDIISLDIDGNPLKTILEYAQGLDMSVGLVSTKYIADATTAAFGAHVGSNAERPEVASQFLEHNVDVIFGGGENDFLPSDVTGCYPEMGKRIDNRNLIEEAEQAGYTIICDVAGFESLDLQEDTKVLGLFADDNIIQPYAPTLAEMTQTAIEILSLNPNGYFLVVEGAMIDIASHLHESQNVMDEVVGLDEAVKVGMQFAELDENTLIIVTADHETGGMGVNLIPTGIFPEDGPFAMPNGTEFYVRWSTGGHTAAHVPVSAYGDGAENLFGLHENTAVFDVMLEFLRVEE
jgi:alkaline phosphatase